MSGTQVGGKTAGIGIASRVVRMLCGIAVWGLVVMLTLLTIVVAINLFDERLSPEAQALLNPPANPYRPDQNIYLSFAGFDAPPGQSVTEVGEARIAYYNARVDLMLKDPMLDVAEVAPKDLHRLKFAGSVDFCRTQDPSLWELLRSNRSNVIALIEQNSELYQRYIGLLDLPGYYETGRPRTVAPLPTDALSAARRLLLAEVILELQSGDAGATQAALGRLRQDVALWRRVLVGQGSLLSKMLAVAYLQTDSWILADMFADPKTYVPPDMDAYLPALTLEDWDIGNAFKAEFRFHDFVYRQAKISADNHWQVPGTSRTDRIWNSLVDPAQNLFFDFNATENLSAKLMNDLARFAALEETSKFAASQARLTQWEHDHSDLFSLGTLYNPIGKVLIFIFVPGYRDYLLRPYDGVAVQRLVRLSYEIRRQRVASAAIPAFLQQHPEWSTHPADGRTFVWNPDTAEIRVQPIAKHWSKWRFSARLWQQP